MNRPEAVGNTHNPKKRHANQPLLSQKRQHQVIPHRKQSDEHGQHRKRTQLNRPPHHLPHQPDIILSRRKCRQKHRLNRRAEIGRYQLRELLPPVITSKQFFIIDLSYQKSIEIIKNRIQKGGAQQLPAKRKHSLHTLQRKTELRLPGYRKEQYQHQRKIVRHLLPHHSPAAKPPVRHGDTKKPRHQRSRQRGEKQPLKLHIPGHIGRLHRDHRPRKQNHRQHPHNGPQFLNPVKLRNGRRREIQKHIHHQRHKQAEITHRRKIRAVRLLFLNQRRAEPILHHHIGDGDKYHNNADHAILRRSQQTGQDDGNHKLHTLGASIFQQLPKQAVGDLALHI